jgi:hypothetical protein
MTGRAAFPVTASFALACRHEPGSPGRPSSHAPTASGLGPSEAGDRSREQREVTRAGSLDGIGHVLLPAWPPSRAGARWCPLRAKSPSVASVPPECAAALRPGESGAPISMRSISRSNCSLRESTACTSAGSFSARPTRLARAVPRGRRSRARAGRVTAGRSDVEGIAAAVATAVIRGEERAEGALQVGRRCLRPHAVASFRRGLWAGASSSGCSASYRRPGRWSSPQ